MPSSSATVSAVFRLSPVSIMMCETANPFRFSITSLDSARTLSSNKIRPIKTSSSLILTAVPLIFSSLVLANLARPMRYALPLITPLKPRPVSSVKSETARRDMPLLSASLTSDLAKM